MPRQCIWAREAGTGGSGPTGPAREGPIDQDAGFLHCRTVRLAPYRAQPSGYWTTCGIRFHLVSSAERQGLEWCDVVATGGRPTGAGGCQDPTGKLPSACWSTYRKVMRTWFADEGLRRPLDVVEQLGAAARWCWWWTRPCFLKKAQQPKSRGILQRPVVSGTPGCGSKTVRSGGTPLAGLRWRQGKNPAGTGSTVSASSMAVRTGSGAEGQAGVPGDVSFRTKPRLAQEMLERALEAGVPFAWVRAILGMPALRQRPPPADLAGRRSQRDVPRAGPGVKSNEPSLAVRPSRRASPPRPQGGPS